MTSDSGHLTKIVMVVDSDTVAMLQPHVDRAADALRSRADMVVDLLATRGWTIESLAWASVVAGLARALDAGQIDLAFHTAPIDE